MQARYRSARFDFGGGPTPFRLTRTGGLRNSRPSTVGPNGEGGAPTHENALVYFGEDVDRFVELTKELGEVKLPASKHDRTAHPSSVEERSADCDPAPIVQADLFDALTDRKEAKQPTA